MFRKFLSFFNIKKYSESVLQSIAFYPVLMSLAFLALAIGSIKTDGLAIIQAMKEEIPYFFIGDYETSRAILSTFIGGIISLTVFSFSMVMIVLNQASSDFSPRLLPSLISNKKHQIILGFYIGTLLYCIILLTALGAYGIDAGSLGLSTMIAALASLVCIGLFVYFINSISVAIQIHNIMDRIYDSTEQFLARELKALGESNIQVDEVYTEGWLTVVIDRTGYYREFDVSLMRDSIKDKDNHIEILPYINEHVWKGAPVLKIRESVGEDELENLLFCFDISPDRYEKDEDITGMIKLMEIAVKAMSPGINDPGTAINSVNKIGQLLYKFLEFPQTTSERVEGSELTITRHSISAQELMRMLIQPIRLYSKHDNSVLHVLLKSLQFIKSNPQVSFQNRAVVDVELEALRIDIERNIENPIDKEGLMGLFER